MQVRVWSFLNSHFALLWVFGSGQAYLFTIMHISVHYLYLQQNMMASFYFSSKTSCNSSTKQFMHLYFKPRYLLFKYFPLFTKHFVYTNIVWNRIVFKVLNLLISILLDTAKVRVCPRECNIYREMLPFVIIPPYVCHIYILLTISWTFIQYFYKYFVTNNADFSVTNE